MVYFILNHDYNAVKIGFSDNPKKRFDQLKTGVAGRLELVTAIPGDRDDERAWHKKYEKSHINGEWFRATEKLLKAINTAKKAEADKKECLLQESLKQIAVPPKPHPDAELWLRDLEIALEIFDIVVDAPEILFSSDANERAFQVATLIRNMKAWGVYPLPLGIRNRQARFDLKCERLSSFHATYATR